MNVQPASTSLEITQKALLDIAIESWRFTKVFNRMISKLDAHEQNRYININQFQWFHERIEASLALAGMQLIDLEGQPFDPGMAITALNIGDFDTEACLLIEQMIEPIIVGEQGIVKTGSVILQRIDT